MNEESHISDAKDEEAARFYLEKVVKVVETNAHLRESIDQDETKLSILTNDMEHLRDQIDMKRRALLFGIDLEGELKRGPG